MPRSNATTVAELLAELPAEERAVVSKLRDTLRRNLPRGYDETVRWGMISYEIPLSRYPNTYNGQPLSYACVASQKNHYSLYLMCAQMEPPLLAGLKAAFKAADKKLDMGKSCIRFKRLEDIPLAEIGRLLARVTPERYIARYEELMPPKPAKAAKPARKAKTGATAKRAAAKKAPARRKAARA